MDNFLEALIEQAEQDHKKAEQRIKEMQDMHNSYASKLEAALAGLKEIDREINNILQSK